MLGLLSDSRLDSIFMLRLDWDSDSTFRLRLDWDLDLTFRHRLSPQHYVITLNTYDTIDMMRLNSDTRTVYTDVVPTHHEAAPSPISFSTQPLCQYRHFACRHLLTLGSFNPTSALFYCTWFCWRILKHWTVATNTISLSLIICQDLWQSSFFVISFRFYRICRFYRITRKLKKNPKCYPHWEVNPGTWLSSPACHSHLISLCAESFSSLDPHVDMLFWFLDQ